MDYTLTNNGAVLMTQVAAGKTLLFTRTESGSGYSANPAVLQNVIDKKQDMFLEEVLFENRQATIKTVLSNMQLEEGYQLRQIGVYAKLEGDEADTLVIIGQQYNGEKIPPYGEGIIQIEYDIAMKVSGTGNVIIEGVGTGYVTKGQFMAHLNDHNNPHQVTKKQIGLELVPNVGTDDQTPAFEEAEERENIVSEERLSVIMGKIRKWFSDLRESAFCSVANNLVTMLPGSVLDARQGKVLDEKISGLYSEIQDLNNGLAALDTRVTNAINGGDLAAPFEMDFLITPYSSSYVRESSSSKAVLDVNTATKLQYTSYAEYLEETGGYNAKITRAYSTAVKIPDNKCILTFSGACLVRSGYAEHIDNNLKVEVLNSAGSKLAETSAINSTANTTVQLSLASLKGQTVKLRVSMMSDGYPLRPRGFIISKLLISNK